MPAYLGTEDFIRFCAHEAGHAVVTWLSPLSDGVHYCTVAPGQPETYWKPNVMELDEPALAWEYIACALAGAVGESLVLGMIHLPGCTDDFIKALRMAHELTQLPAEQRTCPWPAQELARLQGGIPGPFDSSGPPGTNDILNTSFRRAMYLLLRHRFAHSRLALRLAKNWRVESDEIDAIMKASLPLT